MGLAVVPVSTGSIDPSTLQYAGTVGVASFQTGGDKVTLLTGSPMEAVGISPPSFEAAHSSAEIVFAVWPAATIAKRVAKQISLGFTFLPPE
jgi:hypothetical protein